MENIKKKFNIYTLIKLILLIFIFSFIYLLGNKGQLNLLINPQYNIFIVFSLAILLIFILFLFSNLFSDDNHNSKKVLLNKKYFYFILIIILFILFTITPNFDNYFKSASRLKNFNLMEPDNNSQNMVESPSTTLFKKNIDDSIKKKILETTTDIVFTEDNYFNLLNDIYKNIDNYIDKSFTIKGFIYKTKDLDNNYFIIARYLMVCCAADASIIGFICDKSEIDYNFINEDWYEINGIIKKESLNINKEPKTVPVFLIKKYKKIDNLENPYIYPIY